MFEMFLVFVKIGLTAFGGGSVIISLIQNEFVNSGLIKSSEFINALALSQATPGPVAGSLATFIGYKFFGILGILIAITGVSLPTFVIVIVFSNFLNKSKDNKYVEDVFKILRPFVISIVISVFVFLFKMSIQIDTNTISVHQFFLSLNIRALFIFSIMFVLMLKYQKINPAYFIASSAVMGLLIL